MNVLFHSNAVTLLTDEFDIKILSQKRSGLTQTLQKGGENAITL